MAPSTPLMLSIICPGAGQLLQRRWMAGLLFLIAFFWPFCLVMGRSLRFLWLAWGAALAAAEGQASDFPTLTPLALIAPFGFACLVYFISLADVARAGRRRPAQPPGAKP